MKFYIALILFLIIGFIPYFGTIDIIGSQWLYLALINIGFLFYNITRSNFNDKFYRLLLFKPFVFYIIFIAFCFISLVFSNNIFISIIDLSRILITIISVINIIFFSSKTSFNLKHISVLVSIILFCELLYSLIPLIEFILVNDISTIDFSSVPTALKGVSGNKNVLSSNIAFKIPFVIYSIKEVKGYWKFMFSILLSLSFVILLLLISRASLISTAIISLFFAIYFINDRKNLNLISLFSLLTPLFFTIFFVFYTSSIDAISIQNRVNSISVSDTSTNHRLTLYQNAVDYIYNNPFIGCGIGNWKVESLPYWKSKLSGYTVPYHAHNDFLEVSTEVGIFGGLSYLFIFLSIFYLAYKLIRKNQIQGFFLLSIAFVYFFDASLNFPLERALSQVNFIILLFLSYYFTLQNEK